VDARSDVYALGVILYQCATGKRPFEGANAYEVMHAIMTASVPPPSFFRSEIPRTFDSIVLRAMHREPLERFALARELGRALTPFASDPSAWAREFAPLLERGSATAPGGRKTEPPAAAPGSAQEWKLSPHPVNEHTSWPSSGPLQHMLSRVVDGVFVEVHDRDEPTDNEWQRMLEAASLAFRSSQAMCALIVSDGGAPNALQRKQLAAIADFRDLPRAVVTPSAMVRGAAIAMSWLGHRVKGFAPDELAEALSFVGIPMDRRAALLECVASMKRELGWSQGASAAGRFNARC
jgi:hypothetical protein